MFSHRLLAAGSGPSSVAAATSSGSACSQSRRTGFTIVEMLVVIGIIVLIVGLVVPALARVRSESQSTNCLSNLRQLFAAIEVNRQQRGDLLPFAAALPPPPHDFVVVPGLPQRLEKILPRESPAWMCPADHSDSSQEIGTSYIYAPGAFMLAEPPLLGTSAVSHQDRAARLVTQRFMHGYLRGIPVLADSDGYHRIGGREPWNGVFIDGNARPLKPQSEDDQL